MAVKVCCIRKCKSCSTRVEDAGVTYHKFPRDVSLCEIWIKTTRHSLTRTDTPAYVCSRHFCKSDFQIYMDSKYVLKSDAVPSIFPWMNKELDPDNSIMESTSEEAKETSPSKDGEGENLEAIKRFIEDQEKEFLKQDAKNENEGTGEIEQKEVDESKDFDERLAVASSMMDMILSESEERINNKVKTTSKQSSNASDKGTGSMALSVGSKVEAKDFSELWYPAKIVEVDYEEMEVLVHYDNPSKKHDEWINVSSPRLRPLTASEAPSPPPTPAEPIAPTETIVAIEEAKPAEKKLVFVVGERCLARWRDNRRFMATVTKDLGDGQFEVAFDDGFQWKCATTRLHKLKDSSKGDSLYIDTNTSSSSASAQSPVLYGTGPSNIQPPPLTPTPAYHTHLFDPTRDYLGSKSERREMKRKLNIKEIFNIGQKKVKKSLTPKEKVQMPRTPVEKKVKPRIIRRKAAQAPVVQTPKKTIPDAVASIIGSCEDVKASEPVKDVKEEENTDIKDLSLDIKENLEDIKTVPKVEDVKKEDNEQSEAKAEPSNLASDTSDGGDSKPDSDPVQEEEVKLEKFELQDDVKHEEVIDRMKEVINKLEDGIKAVYSPSPQPKEEIKVEVKDEPTPEPVKRDKKLSKIKKGKKLRLLQEKKVKKQVEKVKCELEVMKRQFEEMRQQMQAQTQELAKGQKQEMPESYLLPGEWCCKWVNGQPVGTVSELEGEVRDVNSKPGLPRRSVQVEDKRLPPGWTKHMVRRSLGNSAGKWDVVLVSPDNRRFHTRTDMRAYMAAGGDAWAEHEHALMDFGVHLKLSRRMGWVTVTPGGIDDTPVVPLPAGTLCSTSPLVKRRKLSLNRAKEAKKDKNDKKKKRKLVIKLPKYLVKTPADKDSEGMESTPVLDTVETTEPTFEAPPLEDGYVWVGSLKVQIIENLLRCPAEGCFKNFRNNTLIQMHIKHYHRELRKMLGRTPKVLDLAYARTMPTGPEPTKTREPDLKTIKVKISKPPKRVEEPKLEVIKEDKPELSVDLPVTPVKSETDQPKMQDSPKLRNALVTKKRPRVLLPVRRPDPDPDSYQECEQEVMSETGIDYPLESVDFETAISTHTVTKPADFKKKGRVATLPPRLPVSEEDEWYGMTSDVETRSSFPRSGTPDSKTADQKGAAVSSESNEDKDNFMYSESGERIKIVHMKREEIINCHCGFREEDGLMVQCELCLCWQHALCHNLTKESEVPEKYTCSICLNPRRGRRSQRFLHDQDRLYEGLLPGAKACESLRRSHELSGNLHRIQDGLHALRVKYYVATKKDHPKLYLWAQDWENGEISLAQEQLNSDYSDLNVMISGISKENRQKKPIPLQDPEPIPLQDPEALPLPEPQLDLQTPPSEEHDRYNQRDAQLGSSSLLSGLLSSPGPSLDLPISTSEIETLAKTVQEEAERVIVPQPEAAIENSACRERLLQHIQRCQAAIDARLDSIEAQVAELESQDPSFEDDETADYFPRTKQTIQMLMRDLDTMEELGVIT